MTGFRIPSMASIPLGAKLPSLCLLIFPKLMLLTLQRVGQGAQLQLKFGWMAVDESQVMTGFWCWEDFDQDSLLLLPGINTEAE